MSALQNLIRKKGVMETLELLYVSDSAELKQSEFYSKIKSNNSYVNRFFRVKGELTQNNLIGYKLDENYDKVIFLTTKGKKLHEMIVELNDFLVQ